jgi:hypothetical protein
MAEHFTGEDAEDAEERLPNMNLLATFVLPVCNQTLTTSKTSRLPTLPRLPNIFDFPILPVLGRLARARIGLPLMSCGDQNCP